MRRNLIMHVYPRTAGQKWRRSVAHVCARFELFNGRRIVAVATDQTTDTIDDVRNAFGPCEVELVPFKNNGLQEAQTLRWLLAMVKSADPNEITFRCHSKGCTHKADDSASHPWADAMFEACLDYPALIDCMMERHHTCGAFRSTQPVGWPRSPAWHFAGSCYWLKHSELFKRDWEQVDRVLWGPESYPGWKFTSEESGCLFFDGAATVHLYDPETWRTTVGPALRAWRGKLARCGLSPLCENPPNVAVSELLRVGSP